MKRIIFHAIELNIPPLIQSPPLLPPPPSPFFFSTLLCHNRSSTIGGRGNNNEESSSFETTRVYTAWLALSSVHQKRHPPSLPPSLATSGATKDKGSRSCSLIFPLKQRAPLSPARYDKFQRAPIND